LLGYDAYVRPVIKGGTGIQTALNYTKQAKRGPGLDIEEAIKLVGSVKKESIFKHMKSWVLKNVITS